MEELILAARSVRRGTNRGLMAPFRVGSEPQQAGTAAMRDERPPRWTDKITRKGRVSGGKLRFESSWLMSGGGLK